MKKKLFLINIIIFLIIISCGNNSASEKELTLYARAKSLYNAGDFTLALQLLEKEKFIPSMTLKGKAFYFSNEIEKAENQFRAVLKKRPSSVESSVYLARILREKGDINGAEKIVNTLLSDDPQNIRALRLAADLQKDKGPEYSDNALLYLDRVVEASSETAMAILERARHKWLLGRNEEALTDLAGAKTLFPPETPVLKVVDNLQTAIEKMLITN